MNVVFCGTGWLPIVDFIRDRLPAGVAIRVRDYARPVADELRDAHVILPSNCRIDRAAIEAPAELRLIQQPAAGYDGVDLDAARDRGVPVCNAPGANRASVAEASLYLLLACARRAPAAARAFADRALGVPLGTELEGKTLGIIGMGQTGSTLARASQALGMVVLGATSATSRPELLALLARCDAVAIHCALTPATRGMFDDEAFAALPPGAIVVNVARGPIIDRDALERALAAGRLGGVGLDVMWREPADPDDPLWARDELVVLPHVAGSTREAFARIADIVVDNLARVARGEPPRHRVA